MRLLAISDLHVGYESNRKALLAMREFPGDWLILCGDVGESLEHLEFTFRTCSQKFARVIWVPGNHELWMHPQDGHGVKGEAKYLKLVDLARKYNVLTPEDPFSTFECNGQNFYLAPVFALYDYTFGPDKLGPDKAIEWALEEDISCADEVYLDPAPFASRADWCRSLCSKFETKLAALDAQIPIVLINHFPLRRDLVNLPAIPRFSIWCGTRLTEDWHKRFNISVAVSGHLHLRSTKWRDGVRFEEVSLGYPRQWSSAETIESYICQILPYNGKPHEDRYFGLHGRKSVK